MTDKRPMETAPRDGRYVMVGPDECGNDLKMRWSIERVNHPIFQPEGHGIWVSDGDNFTWSEAIPDGAPEYWREIQ